MSLLSSEKFSLRSILALFLPVGLNPINSTMIAVALPAIGGTFHLPGGTVTLWVVNSYLLINILLQSPAGKLGDVWGQGRCILLGQCFFLGGSILGGLTSSFAGVVLARVCMALGGALLVPAVTAILRHRLPPERRARGFGSFGALMALSAAAGPVLGGFLLNWLSWRMIFWFNVPFLAISLFLGWTLLQEKEQPVEDEQDKKISLDWPGLFFFVASLGAIVSGLKMEGGYANVVLWAGLILLLGFVWWESKAREPFLDLRLFQRVPFVAGCMCMALQYMVMYVFLFLTPFTLRNMGNIGPKQTGIVLLSMTLCMVVAAPLGGRLSESIGPRFTVCFGAAAQALGVSLFMSFLPEASMAQFSLGLGLIGFGNGFCMGPNQAVAISSAPKEQSGLAAGVMSTVRYLGGLVGITILSFLIPNQVGMAAIVSLQNGLWLFLVVSVTSGLFALGLPSRSQSV